MELYTYYEKTIAGKTGIFVEISDELATKCDPYWERTIIKGQHVYAFLTDNGICGCPAHTAKEAIDAFEHNVESNLFIPWDKPEQHSSNWKSFNLFFKRIRNNYLLEQQQEQSFDNRFVAIGEEL